MAEETKDTQAEREALAKFATNDKTTVDQLVAKLDGNARSERQNAAAVLALVAKDAPNMVLPYADVFVKSLSKPEAQTRWECLNILCFIVRAGYEPTMDALSGAEDCLFDEKSGIVREAAFRFFCLFGSSGAKASDIAWPNIDEAVQCFHGNPEFNDMLSELSDFAESDISLETAAALAERMKFDSETARGTLRMRAEQIVALCKKRIGE